MPDKTLLQIFDSPSETPFVIEHLNEEFTSVCPVTDHPDFGTVMLRYLPLMRCVDLKSLKLYYQSFRNEGIYYETVTNQICSDLARCLEPNWMQIITRWRGRGGICSKIISTHGKVPPHWTTA
ncbi:MAG: preQ(1) synthase [Planctomycetota bacterium]|nr:preQ(1) synthase [Planctomycetota bacterium]